MNVNTLMTWNMQRNSLSWNKLFKYLNDENVDIVFLQECGALPDYSGNTRVSIEQKGNFNAGGGFPCDYGFITLKNRSGDTKVYYFMHYVWNTGGADNTNEGCSLSLLIKGTTDWHSRTRVYDPSPDNNKRRPVIGVNIRDYVLYTIHAPSGATPCASKQYVRKVLNHLGNSNYFIGGDFNQSPTNMQGNNNCRQVNALGREGITNPPVRYFTTGEVTQKSGGELDYFISSKSFTYNWKVFPQTTSDHLPVMITLT